MRILKFLLLFILIFIIYKYIIKFKKEKFKEIKSNNLNIYLPLDNKVNNFGDAVNRTFWSKITNKSFSSNPNKIHYITTGSIMHKVTNNTIIFGTGFISQDAVLGNGKIKPKKVLAVRGPLTRQKLLSLNVECPENYGDPLILMPCIYNKYKRITNNIIGIIPHYIDKKNDNFNLLKKNLKIKGYNIKIIDIEIGKDYKNFIDNINCCKYIISSSLHGIIMGLIYKKITIFLEFSDNVIGKKFKFYDFFGSVNINYINKNIYDCNILDNPININYNNLLNLGLKFINLIPFIDNKRKCELSNIYKKFYLN